MTWLTVLVVCVAAAALAWMMWWLSVTPDPRRQERASVIYARGTLGGIGYRGIPAAANAVLTTVPPATMVRVIFDGRPTEPEVMLEAVVPWTQADARAREQLERAAQLNVDAVLPTWLRARVRVVTR